LSICLLMRSGRGMKMLQRGNRDTLKQRDAGPASECAGLSVAAGELRCASRVFPTRRGMENGLVFPEESGAVSVFSGGV